MDHRKVALQYARKYLAKWHSGRGSEYKDALAELTATVQAAMDLAARVKGRELAEIAAAIVGE